MLIAVISLMVGAAFGYLIAALLLVRKNEYGPAIIVDEKALEHEEQKLDEGEEDV